MSRKNHVYHYGKKRHKRYKIIAVSVLFLVTWIYFTRADSELVTEPPEMTSVTTSLSRVPIHAIFLSADREDIPRCVAEAGCNAVVLEMKSEDGSLAYVSALPLAIKEKHSLADPGRNSALRRLNLTPNLYTVACVSFDENEGYLNDICVELASLGFDEILMRGFPTTEPESLSLALAPYPIALSFMLPPTRHLSRSKWDFDFIRYADHIWTNSDLSTYDGLKFPKEDMIVMGKDQNTEFLNWAILD